MGLINGQQILLKITSFHYDQVDNRRQICHMNSWNGIVSSGNDWQSCEVWVQTDPSSSEEFIKDVILFTVTIKKARADNMDSHLTVGLLESKSSKLHLLDGLVLGEWHSLLRIFVMIARSTLRCLTPGHRRRNDDQSLLNGRISIGVLKSVDHLCSFIKIARELRNIENDDIRASYLLHESLWLSLRVNNLNCSLGGWWRDHSTCMIWIESTQEPVRLLLIL